MSRALTLVIGNKNYSSWSLRPWLLLRQFGVDFTEIRLPLDEPEFHARIGDYSPAGKVPVLLDGDLHVWDSLAICEYANESLLGGRAWPADLRARAHARAISAEMHSGFAALRSAMPLNCRKRVALPVLSDDAVNDVARIQSIWREARERYAQSGPFLFGAFSIADAMYAPIAVRFLSYSVAMGTTQSAYAQTLLDLPMLGEWLADAADEKISPMHEQGST